MQAKFTRERKILNLKIANLKKKRRNKYTHAERIRIYWVQISLLKLKKKKVKTFSLRCLALLEYYVHHGFKNGIDMIRLLLCVHYGFDWCLAVVRPGFHILVILVVFVVYILVQMADD